ncbi:hypothetical protein CE91St12_07230 [Bacteroides uniformis]|uniref:Uncharacterized protein n=1 Tax=Bacteroides uniformis TaxID=820 RepID=A0AA37JQ04_BACUN|nr:hypothetical protein CE91St12_07230 [Bacteroides uniformis]GKH35852.1 hypothetical protein CE91St13_07230 [Bacteroides uniformis]
MFSFISDKAQGPKNIPDISQPKMDGSLNFDTSLPIMKASMTASVNRKTDCSIYYWFYVFYLQVNFTFRF